MTPTSLDYRAESRESAIQAANVIAKSRQMFGYVRGCSPQLANSRPAQLQTGPAANASWMQVDSKLLGTRAAAELLARIQQLEQQVRDQPARVDLCRELAALYLEKGRDYEAERLLMRTTEHTAKDREVLGMLEDVKMYRLSLKVAAAEADLAHDASTANRTAVDEAIAERDRVEIDIFNARMRRDPDDLSISYELGRRLKRAGQFAEARQHFERALGRSELSAAAALELGECWERVGRYAEALKSYRTAADAVTSPPLTDETIVAETLQTDPAAEYRADALLRASGIAKQLKIPALARRYLNWLLEIDPDHRGAATLLEKLQQH